MKERPILFSGPMVRAILEGRKTQTRRVVKPQPAHIAGIGTVLNIDTITGKACPYGKPGDRLWVRETWDGVRLDGGGALVSYRADGDKPVTDDGRWHPSIHMPRWASRITLEVVSVRVERLNECSIQDALAEGVLTDDEWPTDPRDGYRSLWESINGPSIRKRLRDGTVQMHSPKRHVADYSWDANPWVWVVEFRRVQ